MNRAHLFEFHDLEWFPATWRDLLTDFLSFFAGVWIENRASSVEYRVVGWEDYPGFPSGRGVRRNRALPRT